MASERKAIGRGPLARLFQTLVLVAVVAGCHEQQPSFQTDASESNAAKADGASNPAGVSGLNYSTYYIASFSITDAEGRTGGGPNISPSEGNGKPAGGGAEMCCAIVPVKWHEGMTVDVRWERDSRPDDKDRSGDQWLKAVAKVPPYKELTHGFWVRFFPNDRISVQVNDQDLYIPDPVKNQDVYVVQGVQDDEANKAMQAAHERDRLAAEEYRKQLREREGYTSKVGGNK